ncbi:MAG: CesT family type III secretion system chaperone [Pseudomonadota bacterium]
MQEMSPKAIELALTAIEDQVPSRAEIQTVLTAYASYVGLQSLKLDERGIAECIVDDELPLTFLHLPHLPGIIVAAPLPGDATRDDALLRGLLRANLSWSNTQGGSFALLPPLREPMLCRLIPLVKIDAATLDRELASFVDLVRAWHVEIELYLDHLPDPPPDPPDRPAPMLRV